MADARFTINADSSNQGFDAAASQVLTLRLKTLPVSGVSSVSFQVWNPAGFDASLGPDRNPPRASKGAPLLTLVGASSGQNVSPVAVDGTVQVTLPNDTGHSWIVRCVVNGGMRTVNGRSVFDASLVHERMIVIRSADDDSRRVIVTETTQYEDDGWAPEIRRGEKGDTGPVAPPPTGSSNGYLSRTVIADGTVWSLPAHVPDGGAFEFLATGPGGGGGSGQASKSNGTANIPGGAGAGGGARPPPLRMSRAQVLAELPITFTVPAGGVGGASVTHTGSIGNTPGLSGTTSTAATIVGLHGTLLVAGAGGNGVGNGGNAGMGGGCWSSGSNTLPGRPRDMSSNSTEEYTILGGAQRNAKTPAGTSANQTVSEHGGGGAAVSVSCHGGISRYGGGGGAYGATSSLINYLPQNGLDGGGHDYAGMGVAPFGGGGGAGSVGAASGTVPAAANGADGDDIAAGKGGGGGGSWGNSSSVTPGKGGDGGNGGFPGGGGGGGGCCNMGGGNGGIGATSGKGGDGGAAQILCFAYAG